MKVGVYFCNCGSIVSEKINPEAVEGALGAESCETYLKTCDFICSEEGKEFLRSDLIAEKPDRVVVAACSPREYESTFRGVLAEAGLNPYYLQMVNIREQVAWVTENPAEATAKAAAVIRAAVARVRLHAPLEKIRLEVCGDVLVIGAGPAGLKAALLLAEAGRKVTLVEKSPVLGGLPVRYEELFPAMECGPCLLEPVLGEVLHGDHSTNIEVLTLAEVTDVVGYYGNFTVKVRRRPRYVDTEMCMGCMECVAPCPVSTRNEFNCRLDERKAIAFPFLGALPNAPFLDWDACLRSRGEDCRRCLEACPVEDAIDFDDTEETLERRVGAIVVAVGAGLYDPARLPQLGYGTVPDVYTSLEFERITAANGPTGGALITRDGRTPETVALVHCVGSLDKNHCAYCSGVCCEAALKYGHLAGDKAPGAKVVHYFKEMVSPGKDDYALHEHARGNPDTTFIRYSDIADLRISASEQGAEIRLDENGVAPLSADMVVLCPAVVPPEGAAELAGTLDLARDRFGFFAELHGRLDAARAKKKGFFLAGSCQAPMDIRQSMNHGLAAASYILAGLVEGREMVLEPIVASVDKDRCSACRVCATVCPYKAISLDEESGRSQVSAVLCQGCGTCVAACPAGAITGNHFTDEQILAEMEACLA